MHTILEKENKWNKTNQWENEIEQLHAIVRKTPLVETTKWGGPVYTYNNKNVLGIGGFKSYFGIWFYNGVFLKDEKNCLSMRMRKARNHYAKCDLIRLTKLMKN